MSDTIRPRRSVLYIPGSKPRALEKARGLAADALILDLEDAVAPDAKAEARALVAAEAGAFAPREVAIRVNGLDTGWGAEDLRAAAGAGADAVLIPKVEGPEMLDAAARALDAAGAPAGLALWAMIETPRGVLEVARTAAHPRLAVLVMGTNDLVADMRAEHVPDRAPVLAALTMSVLAARAEGRAIVDGVCNAFRDEAALSAECAQGRALGMDGKTLIHPAQVEVANRVFAPSEEAVVLAGRQLAAFAEAEAAGQGVAVVDGKIVENLHAAEARRVLTLAAAIAARDGAAGSARAAGK